MKKIMVLGLSLILIFALAGCKEEDEFPVFEFNVPSEFPVNLQELGYAEYVSLSNPVVTINVRGIGEIVIQLFPGVAPNTVNNFIKYIQDEAYTDNTFHRVINGFMLQGGYLPNPSCTIVGEMTNNGFENNLSHTAGVLSMARVGNSYDSGSSQFFIMHQDSPYLDDEYTSFGGVISGFHIINYIASFNDSEINEITSVPIFIDSITVDLNGYVASDPVCID